MVPSPTTAMPPQVMPLASSSHTKMRRHWSTITSPRGLARNLCAAAIIKNFTEMTAANQAEACTTGAQNMEASEKMTASRGRVTRADSSLRTNMSKQLVLELWLEQRTVDEAVADLADVSLHAARDPWRAGAAGGLTMSAPCCIVSLATPAWPMPSRGRVAA